MMGEPLASSAAQTLVGDSLEKRFHAGVDCLGSWHGLQRRPFLGSRLHLRFGVGEALVSNSR